MAGERTLPGISLTGFWNAGDNTWKAGNDANLLKLSVLVQLRVLSRVIFPPADNSNSLGVANGDIYIVPVNDSNSMQSSNSVPRHNDIAVFDNGAWVYYTPLNGFRAYVIDESAYYKFNGTTWVADGGSALNIAYNSGTSGDSNSTETNVADALDDLYERVRNVSAGIIDASTVNYNSGDGGDSNSTETTVQGALDDIYGRVRAVEGAAGGITFVVLASAAITLTAADDKKFYMVEDDSNSAGFCTIGIPADSLEDLPDGFTVSAVQIGAGNQVTFAEIQDSNSPDDLVLIYPADMQPRTRGQNSVITALKTSVANRWLVFGDLEPV